MSKLSRRALARYAADQLLAGESAAAVGKKLAAVLIESGTSADADFLINDISAELEDRRALTIATVSSAAPLSPELRKSLAAQLKKATGTKDVMLDEKIDKTVIGGTRIETPSRVWDYTVASRLAALKEMF